MTFLLSPRPASQEPRRSRQNNLRLTEGVDFGDYRQNRVAAIEEIDRAVQGFSLAPREEPSIDVEESSSPTVLLVDDDDMVRRFIATALTRLGYRVFEASDGEEGIERYTEHRDQIDVIVSDVLMPVLTGPEMVRKINAAGVEPTRVLFVTGYSDNHLPSEFSGDFPGAKRLNKPFSVDELSRTVEDLMN